MKVVKQNKYIRIIEVPEPRHKDSESHLIFNKSSSDVIGWLEYYPKWRQYVFSSGDNIIWNNTCLETVIELLNELNSTKVPVRKPGD